LVIVKSSKASLAMHSVHESSKTKELERAARSIETINYLLNLSLLLAIILLVIFYNSNYMTIVGVIAFEILVD